MKTLIILTLSLVTTNLFAQAQAQAGIAERVKEHHGIGGPVTAEMTVCDKAKTSGKMIFRGLSSDGKDKNDLGAIGN